DARCAPPCAARLDLEAQLSTVHEALGHREQALAHATKAVDIAGASFGADHPGTAVARFKLCIARDTLGDHDSALHDCTAAHDVLARALGEHNPETAVVLGMLGAVEIGAGKIEEGRAHMRQSHATLVEQVGPAHPDAIGVLANLGWSYVERHEAQTAVEVVGPALRALAAHPEADPIGLAAIHHNYATALIELGRNAEAVPSLQRAIALRSAVPGMRAEELVNNRTQLGGALFHSGRKAEAIAPLESAMYDERADDAIYNRVLRRYYLAASLRDTDAGRARRIADDALGFGADDVESAEIIAAIRELREQL
ncbi:MAG TPA: tetratricopeptide repeat protein, partial [Nannocystaceae bacterium]|nr:tetratricopeptide repeat protein [Nannocystaceae bacterium]